MDDVMFVAIVLIIGILVGCVVYTHISDSIDDTLHPYFYGNTSVGKPGEDHMPYGWYCYEKTPHNLRMNKNAGWAVNDRGICEWR